MVTFQNQMRGYMKLMESPYIGPKADSPHVSYDAQVAKSGENKGSITKVIATLSSYESGKYTKLAQNIQRMQDIAQETLALEAAVKDDAREVIADLFNAEDAAYTRVVETVSFTLQLTKDPKPATTVQYAKVLKELESHLTPELLKVLESIKDKFSSVNPPKPAALSYDAKPGGVGDKTESIQEASMNGMKEFFSRYLSKILAWGQSYDRKLAALKQQASASLAPVESIQPVSESAGSITPNQVAFSLWKSISGRNSMLQPIGEAPKGAVISVKTSDNSVFEVSVKQIS